MGFPAVGVAGMGAPPACVGEVPLPQPVHQGSAVRARRQFHDERGVHVIRFDRIPCWCHGVALLAVHLGGTRSESRVGPGLSPRRGSDPGQGLTTRRRKTRLRRAPLFCKRGASFLPVPTHDYGTNRPQTAAAASATDSRRRTCDRCNRRPQVIPHHTEHPTDRGHAPMLLSERLT